MKKKRSQNKNNIRKKKSSNIAEFIKRPLPSEEEVEKFEEYITDQIEESNKRGSQFKSDKERENDINDSLSEIYKDSNGNQVHVDKLDIKKRKGIIFWFFTFVFVIFLLLGAGMAGFYYLFDTGTGLDKVQVSISGESQVRVNEEFQYIVECHNGSRVALEEMNIELDQPDNFIATDYSVKPTTGESRWEFSNVPAGETKKIKIEGKIIDKKGSSHILLASMRYMPANFSSEFKKEDSFSTSITGSGIEVSMDYPSNLLVGEEGSITLNIEAKEERDINNFLIKGDIPENTEIISTELSSSDPVKEGDNMKIGEKEKGVWQINNLRSGNHQFNLKFRFNKKASQTPQFSFDLGKKIDQEKEYIFTQKKFSIKAMDSDLDLNMVVEGGQKDKAIDFGQKLNYSITYANRGETAMKDVVIMAVLESDILDWTSLEDNNNGKEKGNTLTWTKEQIPKLENLEVGEKGAINFSIEVMDFREGMLDSEKNFRVESYAQFDIRGTGNDATGTSIDIKDNKSNVVTNPVNSNVALNEKVRYFNENNLPVGSGPLPPKVGEETTYKVYWTVTNSLHDLEDTKVEVELPEHIEWNEGERTSVGNIEYKKEEHKIVWGIGDMPTTVYRTDAEFSISLTPKREDANKVMVLSPGGTVTATDVNTEATIEREEKPTTTKLKDDDIAEMSSDGRIME